MLCSTARRARETFDRIEPALVGATVRHEPEIYAATVDTLLELLQSVPDATASVLMIGHNPAIEQLALDLARPSPERDDVETKFPTAALATLDFSEARWSSLHRGGATLVNFNRPRDLES